MTEREQMLAAVFADPQDDTVRLAYADFLDEHPDKPCPQCMGTGSHGLDPYQIAQRYGTHRAGQMLDALKCGVCDGTGTVIDTSDADRAELIRNGVALARCGPPYRELFVADGAGTRLEGIGVALIPHGDGHYSVSSEERGLSTETFAPNERVDIYAHLARNDRIRWIRGMRYVKHLPERHQIIFRKDADSEPWPGTALRARERELLSAHPEWGTARCPSCDGQGRGGLGSCVVCNGTGNAFAAHLVTWHRGFPGVKLTREECWRKKRVQTYKRDEWGAAEYESVYEPTALAVALCAAGMDRIEVEGFEPTLEEGGWEWYDLPDFLNLPITKDTFATREAALLALAWAVALWVRSAGKAVPA